MQLNLLNLKLQDSLGDPLGWHFRSAIKRSAYKRDNSSRDDRPLTARTITVLYIPTVHRFFPREILIHGSCSAKNNVVVRANK